MGRYSRLLPLVFLFALGACSSNGPRTINLMPAPAVFAGGAIDPFPEQPPLTHTDFGLLYATDRRPSDDLDERPFYLNQAGFILRLGEARIQAGGDISWEEARRISLSSNRKGEYPLKVRSVAETAVLGSSYTVLTRMPEAAVTNEYGEQEFA
ncbi:MAG: hypothetical protein O7F73_03150, partial [Gammaproteobacteria bacterium]|nr:hypothetical protein [Gammaproteobacteria bacterium]